MNDITFSTIDALSEKYLKIWENCCNIESPTDYKRGVDEVGAYFSEIAKENGWRVEIFEQKISGNVVAITMNPEAKAPPISLSAHIDTVQPIGSCGAPAVKIDGDKIYGPGVIDCKGGVVAAMLSMEALSKCGYNQRPIQLLLQSDEENGSRTSDKATINYICEKAQSSIAFLNLEGNETDSATIQRKGILTYSFKVFGQEAHTSMCAKIGANAIAEAAYKIIEIEKLKDHEGITCCCSGINGGTAANIVPGLCEFTVNIRFATVEQEKWIRDYMQRLAAEVKIEGCRTELKILSHRVAMEKTQRNLDLLEQINMALEQNGLPILTAAKRNGGSDAADVTNYGIPCVDSLGVRGGEIHTDHEFAYIDSLPHSAKMIASIIEYLK